MPTINGQRSLTQQAQVRSNVSPSVIDTLAKRITALTTTYSKIMESQRLIDAKLSNIENDLLAVASVNPVEPLVNVKDDLEEVTVEVEKLRLELTQVLHVSETVERGLRTLGINTVSELAVADADVVSDGIKGVGPKKAQAMIADAQALTAEE